MLGEDHFSHVYVDKFSKWTGLRYNLVVEDLPQNGLMGMVFVVEVMPNLQQRIFDDEFDSFMSFQWKV